jgi:TolA-binding protein
MKAFYAVLLSAPFLINAQEIEASDILFLKIQELEGELATLRSELESQAYLIEKLLNEESNVSDIADFNDSETPSLENVFRFEGINDSQSIEQVYERAVKELNEKDFASAQQSFQYLTENFNDEEKIPLSLFWLGEISLMESQLEEGLNFFQQLASDHPNHWRTPLAHKKIGDILMMSGDQDAAKIKYQFVVQSFPENTASSLALQLLENME